MNVSFLLAALCVGAGAQTRSPEKGYVVRAEAGTVWLDLTAADGAAPGRSFEVYSEGAELKHPVTGASLGRVRDAAAEGTIREVQDKFSTGVLTGNGRAKAGQRARLTAPAAAAPPAASAPAQAGASAEPGRRAARTRGATLNYAAVGMAAGDFAGTGTPQIAVAAEDAVRLYAYPATDARVLAEAALGGTGSRILSLEAADLDGDGKAELFASLYDQGFRRFETRVLKLDGGRWAAAAELPFLVRVHQDPAGARVLASQQILDDRTFPLGTIYPVAYRNGRYIQDRPAIRHPRADWIYGFTTAGVSKDDPAVILLTSVHALRAQFAKSSWRSPDEDYGQTPVRVRWNDRLLEFNPPMPAAYGPAGFEALFAARNFAALGGLASPFGVFNRGEVARKRWNGLAFETEWSAELPGCVQGLAIVSTAPGRRELAAVVRGAAEKSSIWTFDF
ncbi:MAG: VCBS repeat-containing protein [Elusimicrobia bacterium]|nr:VCBS repeat-containing protein [Elusimicrobiota bacterium]